MTMLPLPSVLGGTPAPGKPIRVTLPSYRGTAVHHMLYLPADWQPDRYWPVLVEYTGNFAPWCGSTGECENAHLGFGLTEGEGFIWAVMPYVSEDHCRNETTWWGDAEATAAYCREALDSLCAAYGGDRGNVHLCGFSRGAIAANYIGLRDDRIAPLWRSFIANEHYDGLREWEGTAWGLPLSRYREEAKVRLGRLHGRPVLLIQNDNEAVTAALRQYLEETGVEGDFTFLDVPVAGLFGGVPNEFFPDSHTDQWLLSDNSYTEFARRWLRERSRK